MALTVDPKATVRILRMADHLIQFPVVRAAADLIEEQDAKLTAIREWVKAHNYTDVSKVWEIRRILDGLAEREEQ